MHQAPTNTEFSMHTLKFANALRRYHATRPAATLVTGHLPHRSGEQMSESAMLFHTPLGRDRRPATCAAARRVACGQAPWETDDCNRHVSFTHTRSAWPLEQPMSEALYLSFSYITLECADRWGHSSTLCFSSTGCHRKRSHAFGARQHTAPSQHVHRKAGKLCYVLDNGSATIHI